LSYKPHSQRSNYRNQRQRSSFGKRFGNGFKQNREDTSLAQESFEQRSKQSQVQDLIRLAPFAPNIEAYLKAPNRFDWANVDGVDPKLIFSHKTAREQATDLAKVAEKAESVEVWVKNTAQSDLQNVDDASTESKTKISAKTKRFKVVKKADKKKEIEAELKKAEEKALVTSETQESVESKRRLPSKEEIEAEAQQLWLKENAKPKYGDMMEGIAAPTRTELAEEGYLQMAKLKLMTSEDTEASRQTFGYVDNIRQELEKIGFTVIPMEGFSSEDLQF